MIGINSFGEMNENSDQYINRANQEGHGTVFLAQQIISNLRIMKLDRFSLSTMKDFFSSLAIPVYQKRRYVLSRLCLS